MARWTSRPTTSGRSMLEFMVTGLPAVAAVRWDLAARGLRIIIGPALMPGAGSAAAARIRSVLKGPTTYTPGAWWGTGG